MSVTVVDFAERENRDGEKFYSLLVSAGVEMGKGSNGKHYATIRTASVPSTLNEAACRSIIGSELPGSVKKVECEEYDFTNHKGETVSLNYTWQYVERDPSDEGADFSTLFE